MAWQARFWNPVIDWALAALDAPFEVTLGVVHKAQPPEALGLFKDTPELIDRAMAHVVEMRSRSRMRPAK